MSSQKERKSKFLTIGVLAGWQVYWDDTPMSSIEPYFSGINVAAQERNCNILLACGLGSKISPIGSDHKPAWPTLDSQTDFVPVGSWNTDGLIIIKPLLPEASEAYVQSLHNDGFPVVVIGVDDKLPSVTLDNKGGIKQVVDHMVKHGHTQIAFIAGHPEQFDVESQDRLQAFKDALKVHNLDVHPDLIRYGYHVVEGGQIATQQILESKVPFTALVASNDQSAFGAINMLKKAGLCVPEDVAVIGFDDRLEAFTNDPPLTTVRNPFFERGFQALEMLVDQIESGKSVTKKIVVPTKLIIRRSCGSQPDSPIQDAMNMMQATAVISSLPDSPKTTPEPKQLLHQFQQSIVEHRLMINHVGILTSRLLTAMSETHIFNTLQDTLPVMGISHCEIAFFKAEDDDPVALSELHHIGDEKLATYNFVTREFPPPSLYDEDTPFSLALYPLTIHGGRTGYVAFDTKGLNVNAFIVQQLASVFRGIHLYAEVAREYRRAEEVEHLKDPSQLIDLQEGQEETSLPLIEGHQILLIGKKSDSHKKLNERLEKDGINVTELSISDLPSWSLNLVEDPPQAILLDMELEAQERWEALNSLKKNPATEEVPILFYSFEAEKDAGTVFELDYLSKPIGTVQLERALIQKGLDSPEDDAQKTILIVEDDPNILKLHTRVVQQHAPSYKVLQTRNGADALAIMRKERPDLILLDLRMPVMDGFEVLEVMQSERLLRDIPVIVLTGHALTQAEIERLNRGVTAVLGKGLFSVEETLERINSTLQKKLTLGTDTRRSVRKAMAYIHLNYSQNISRTDLADHVGVSEGHLARSFRREMGISPMAYLNRYRIDQAKTLLINENLTIVEVASAVGFSDSSYFSRVFKRQVGMSPRKYIASRS